MSRNIWIISDTHFSHENIIKYCNRPFSCAQEMDEIIIQNWNSVVKNEDIIYHLGDVYTRDGHKVLPRLKGRKRLILGNHDNGKDQNLLKSFQKITCWRKFVEFGVLLTHVPVNSFSLDNKTPVNIHGHIHQNEIDDTRYKNVSVEQINYTPINMEELRVR